MLLTTMFVSLLSVIISFLITIVCFLSVYALTKKRMYYYSYDLGYV